MGSPPGRFPFYEEHCVVEARRDAVNPRYYDRSAHERSAWIARLRRADLSLEDIRDVFDAEVGAWPRRADEKIGARRAQAVPQLREIDLVLEELDWPVKLPS